MDETAALSDLILPNHSYLERYEDIPVTAGLPKCVIGLSIPVVAPQLNTRHTGDVILSLAGAMKGSISDAFPWENYTDCLKTVLGNYWNPLHNTGYAEISDVIPPEKAARFAFQVPDNTFPTAPEGDEKTLPLILIPNDSLRLSSGAIGSPPFLMKIVSDTILKDNDILVEVNPVTAGKYGLKEGGCALLKTPKGAKKVKIHLSQGIGEGIVSVATGLGHTAYDRYLADKGVNVNELIGPVEDPVSGFDVAWGIRASLTNV
jgi:anaerobic selenocysteine-containing dehydrogenase